MIGYLLPLLLMITGSQDAAPAKRVIASSSDWSITAEQFDAIVKTFPEQDRLRYVDPEYRRGLVNELVRIWVLCAEARKKGIAVASDYESQKNYYQKYAREIDATISDDAVRNYYDGHIDDFTVITFSHILILNGDSPISPYPNVERLPYKQAENKAKEIKAMLDNGADWNEVSKEYSQAIDVKDTGGTGGSVSKGQVEKSIENALFSMKVGEISDVVGSVYGFHILRVTDRKVRSFEDLRGPIRQKLIGDEVNRQMEPKVKEAGVTIDESFFQ